MTLFYMYNPKMWFDPGGLKPVEADPIKRRKEEDAVEIIKEEIPKGSGKRSVKTQELQGEISKFIGVSSKMRALEAEKKRAEDLRLALIEAELKELAELRQALSTAILQMNEEEEILLMFMMLN